MRPVILRAVQPATHFRGIDNSLMRWIYSHLGKGRRGRGRETHNSDERKGVEERERGRVIISTFSLL